jgi:hypothetical protein
MPRLKILAHRGYWRSKAEQNSPAALVGALERGYARCFGDGPRVLACPDFPGEMTEFLG